MRKRSRNLYNLFRVQCAISSGLVITVLLVLIAAGCARQPKVSAEIVAHSKLTPSLVERLSAVDKVRTAKVYADAELVLNGQKKRFEVAIVAELPDKVRFEFIDPLAGVVSTIISKPGMLIYADSKGFSVWSGAKAVEVFQKETKLPWGPEDVVRIILGSTPKAVDFSTEYPVDREDRRWLAEGTEAVRCLADATTYMNVDRGRISAEIVYSDYRKVKGAVFPQEVTVEIGRPKRTLTLKYRHFELNDPVGGGIFDKI